MTKIQDISDVSLQLFLEYIHSNNKKKVILFMSEWSGQSHIINVFTEKIAREFSGQLDVYQVDIENCNDIAEYYGIKKVPVLLFINNQVVCDYIEGIVPLHELNKKVFSFIKML